jgi:hypothetical protein
MSIVSHRDGVLQVFTLRLWHYGLGGTDRFHAQALALWTGWHLEVLSLRLAAVLAELQGYTHTRALPAETFRPYRPRVLQGYLTDEKTHPPRTLPLWTRYPCKDTHRPGVTGGCCFVPL